MNFRSLGHCSLLVLFSWLLLVASSATAQDDGDDHNLVYSFSEIRSSPFDPNDKDIFFTDNGPGLDTGCTFDTDPEHPLTIDILIDAAVGPVDADGFLENSGQLIADGVIPSTVTIIMPAFDIDINGPAPPERDEVAFNGETLGLLNGNDGIWLLNEFTVPIDKVKFPAPPAAPGDAIIPQENRVVITVDTLSSDRWCAAIDWVGLIIPIKTKAALTLKPKASNSNQIRKNSGSGLIDTIFQQSWKQNPDGECEIVEDIKEPIENYPFSGASETGRSGSSNIKIETKIEPCPAGSRSLSSSTEVSVKWAVKDTSLSGNVSWSGLEGDVTIQMPDKIGDYEVTFEYTVGEEELPDITRKLLVTKSPPLGKDTPTLNQYNLATSWALGKIANPDILEGLLQGIYSHGQAWQYTGNPNCNWEKAVDSPSPSCPTDCYLHSTVFEKMAGVLGVGGMTPIRETGANDRGFITKGSPSLDPLFFGSARPYNSLVYDKYYFGVHSLRKLGTTFYDATFNGVYSSQNEFILWNYNDGEILTDSNGEKYTVSDEGATIYNPLIGEKAYHNWAAYRYKNPGTPLVTAVTNMAISPDVEIASTAIYSTLDVDSNGVYEALIANVDITIITPGTYLVRGILTKNGAVISNQPVFETQLNPRITVGDQPGIYNVALQFSGEDIYQSGEDGPYTIEILTYADTGEPARKNLTTPSYAYTKFGENSGHILTASDSVLDTDNDTRYDFLVIDVDADILNAGTYTLQGALLKDGNTIANASESFILVVGQQKVALQFSGVGIFRSEQDGPYDAVISLLNQAGERQDFIEFVTQSHNHSQFEGIVDIAGAFNDQGIDTNANSLFDVLRVDFGVDVREAGTYQVTAALGNLVDTNKVYSDAVMNLAFGAQTMTLNFSGPEINSQEMDGPYIIEISLHDPVTNKLLDQVGLVQQTADYSHLDFDPLGGSVKPIILTGNSSDEGIDNNANGLFDLLKVSVELKVVNSDTYTWSARLVDSDGTELGFDSRSSFLNAGTASIDFFFDGPTIGQNGVAGPYQVKGLLISGQGGANLVSSQVATTQAYGADEFEGFVAQQEGDIDGDGDGDRDDLKLIQAARNTPASGSNDPLDLDGDGMITGLDARKLILLCTRPRCAT